MATFSMGRQIQYGPGRLIGCENGNKQKTEDDFKPLAYGRMERMM